MVTEQVSVECHRCGYFTVADNVQHAMQLLKGHEAVCLNPKPARFETPERRKWRRFVRMLNGNHV